MQFFKSMNILVFDDWNMHERDDKPKSIKGVESLKVKIRWGTSSTYWNPLKTTLVNELKYLNYLRISSSYQS